MRACTRTAAGARRRCSWTARSDACGRRRAILVGGGGTQNARAAAPRRAKAVLVDGQIRRVRPDTRDPDRWVVKLEGAHPGYITWERYVQNQEKLRQNTTRTGNSSHGAPREGPALLSGLLICGRCGYRMGPVYARGARARFWAYACHGDRFRGQTGCWTVAGARIDAAVEQLFLETMVPSDLDLSLAGEEAVAGHGEELARAG